MEITDFAPKFRSYPSPPAQKLWVGDFDRITTHTRGRKSEVLICKRRPHEDEEVRRYREENFRAITRPAFTQFITNFQRTISHSSVEIFYPEKVADYLNGSNFYRHTFLSWLQKIFSKAMIEDANGLLVAWPEGVGDVTKQLTVKPIIVHSYDIKHYDDEVLTWLSTEKSEVNVAGEMKMVGNVYYIMLETELWKRVQIGDMEDDNYRFEYYYANPAQMIYAMPLGGDETSGYTDEFNRIEVKYLTSFISGACEFGDECVVEFSDYQGIRTQCASPIRVVVPMDCDNPECDNGWISDPDTRLKSHLCPRCAGTKRMPLTNSPYSVIVRPKIKDSINSDGNRPSEVPVIDFLHPGVDILENANKAWQSMHQKTEDALDLIFTEEAQSGVAKNVDREDKQATIDKMAGHIYQYIAVNFIQLVHMFQYPGEEVPDVPVNMPSTFIVKKENELVADLQSLRAAGAPTITILEKNRQLQSQTFSGDPVRMKAYDVNVAIDPLFAMDDQQKSKYFSSEVITEDDMTTSLYAPGIIANYARETPNFSSMSVDEIVAVLSPIIQLKVDAVRQQRDNSAEVREAFTR